MKIFDWLFGRLNNQKTLDVEKAVKICKMFGSNVTIYAGIQEDFYFTADTIFKNGNMVYGANPQITSDWGTPCLFIEEQNQFIPCWTYGYMPWRKLT